MTKTEVAAACLIAAVVLFLTAIVVRPPPAAGDGAVRTFAHVDLALASGDAPPATGWRPVVLSGQNLLEIEGAPPATHRVAWLRFRVDGASLPRAPLALYGPRLRERSALYVNGQLFRRDFVHERQIVLNWNNPLFTELPPGLLRPGANEIVLRLDAPLHGYASATPIRIGDHDALWSRYAQRLGVQIVLPRAINGVIAILSLGLLLLWFKRPKESVYGWLAAVGAVWFARNLHYYVYFPPFDPALFWNLSFDALFALMIALYGFAATFFQLPYRGRIVTALCVGMVVLVVLGHAPFIYGGKPFFLILFACVPTAMLVTGALAYAFFRAPSWTSGFMLAAIVAAIVLSVNDLLLMMHWLPDEWFYLQPYASLLVFTAFGLAVGQRVADSLSAVERMNVDLEHRIDAARAALAASEQERRRLEVAYAVDQERERLMREMHDGIGSNLVTALAAAQMHGESPRTIETLQRCLTDLKLTVDSLEPFEGDVAALLASLRYRIEPQLEDAGLALEWRVEPVERLAWLDAVSALHLLRIVQEALSNIVAHARAATISIIAHNAARDGAGGVRVAIADDGIGLNGSTPEGGKGIAIMRARAAAIGASVAVNSGKQRGVEVELWLPAHP